MSKKSTEDRFSEVIDNRVEKLEEENAILRDRLETIEAMVADEGGIEADGALPVSRRGAMAGIAGLGALGLGATGSAAADVQDDDLYGTEHEGDGEINALRVRNDNSDAGSRAVLGQTSQPNSNAFVGHTFALTGSGTGLVGRSTAEDGVGLRGVNDNRAPTDNATGVEGLITADAVLQDGDEPEGIQANDPVAVRAKIRTDEIDSSANPVGVKAEVDVNTGAENVVGIESDAKAVIHDDLEIDSGGEIHIEDGGSLNVSGTKHFVHAVETPTGNKKVRYTSVEAGKALTEVSEVAEMDGGRAEIELPEHFEMVTSDEEPLSVQVTPYAKEEVKPQVVEQSTDRIVVEDFSDTDYDYTFAYTVKGVREGFEDEEIVVDDE